MTDHSREDQHKRSSQHLPAESTLSSLGGLEDDPHDPLEALIFCPECATREFDSD